ncbi:DUF4131 domain-containing protein [Anaerolineae bacterium CFX7]|nr:DUF4131 domain-containing protein [Anaerolineae bacterium CFX7]
MILIYLVAGWVVGILTASFLKLPTQVWLLLALLPLGYLALFWRELALRKWHLVLIFFILGALRYQLALPDEISQQLKQFNEQGKASLIGVVIAEPDVRQTQTLVRVDVSKIQTNGAWQDVHGLALVSVARDTPVQYGDEVQVDGAPETPPDGADFSYRDYLAREHVFTLIRHARLYTIASGKGNLFWARLYEFKAAAETAIAELLPEPSAALLTGILLGDDSGIPSALKQAFADTNTAHIIAISGFNIAVLIGVLAFVLRRPSYALQARALNTPTTNWVTRAFALLTGHFNAILIIIFLILYTLLVGASASVVRACIMGSLVVIALDLGRTSWAFNALAISAFIMTLLNPWVLWDVGFQLSFLATLGLLLYAPRLQTFFEGWLKKRVSADRARHIAAFFQDAFIVTFAAFIVTAPLIIVYFHRLSLIGFLTNFLVLPVQPAVMVLGGAATLVKMAATWLAAIPLVELILGGLAQALAWAAYVCLQYTILVVQTTAAIPFGSFEVTRLGAPFVLVFYAALFIGTRFGLQRATGLILTRVWVAIALLALITMFVWTAALASPDARTHVNFIAAADGDATLIRTANDQRLLINGTNEPGALLSYLGTQLPPWDRRLDVIVVTHLDDDNLAALNAVLERYTVAQVVEPPPPARPGISYAKWRALTQEKNIAVIPAQQGVAWRAGDATFKILYPPAETDASYSALQMFTDGRSFLFAPALRKTDRDALLRANVLAAVDVAVLPNEIEKEWAQRVTPANVIFFSGNTARTQPAAATLQLFDGSRVWQTHRNGDIEFLLDGETMQATAEK